MNCQRVRRVLLAAERPEPPPVEVRPHLADCLECRAWLRRLGSAERQLAWLPVPATQGKQRLLLRLREAAPDRTPLRSIAAPLPVQLKERALRKLSVAFALAAAVAAFAVGLSFWPHRELEPKSALVNGPERRWDEQRVTRLAQARTPSEHVKALADFAVNLQDEAADLAGKEDGARLELLSNYYDKLVRQDLVAMSECVPADERDDVLQATRTMLVRTESEMERLAAAAKSSAGPLRQIARAAREGDRRLRQLLQG